MTRNRRREKRTGGLIGDGGLTSPYRVLCLRQVVGRCPGGRYSHPGWASSDHHPPIHLCQDRPCHGLMCLPHRDHPCHVPACRLRLPCHGQGRGRPCQDCRLNRPVHAMPPRHGHPVRLPCHGRRCHFWIAAMSALQLLRRCLGMLHSGHLCRHLCRQLCRHLFHGCWRCPVRMELLAPMPAL